MRKKNVAIISLGCPRNLVDSEEILSQFTEKGYSVLSDFKGAHIGIVNTCAFIEDARRESIDAILDLVELKKQGKIDKIIVYGCLVQRYGSQLQKELPEVDAFVGRIELTASKRAAITPHYSGYLKICEGCLNSCSYCVIPSLKGKFKSLSPASIIEKARILQNQGVRELNIIGQDISAYGADSKEIDLTGLVKNILDECKEFHWIRLLYLNPLRVSDELLRLIADEPRICKYIDIPIQHCQDRILDLMNRRMTKESILNVIKRARTLIPDVVLRTAVIVGFPSETDKEFQELVDFIQEIKFERLGAFMYSREENTPAYDFKPQISSAVKKKRFNQVMSVQQKVSAQVNEKMLGRVCEVLIEEKDKTYYSGRSMADAPEVDGNVFVRSKENIPIGSFVNVRIIDTLEYDLIGEVIS